MSSKYERELRQVLAGLSKGVEAILTAHGLISMSSAFDYFGIICSNNLTFVRLLKFGRFVDAKVLHWSWRGW